MPSRKKQFIRPNQTSWPVIGLVVGEGQGGSSPPPSFTPSLDFSDARNSQYIGQVT